MKDYLPVGQLQFPQRLPTSVPTSLPPSLHRESPHNPVTPGDVTSQTTCSSLHAWVRYLSSDAKNCPVREPMTQTRAPRLIELAVENIDMIDSKRCALGGQRLADRECSRCGTAVCRMHYDGEMRLCAECAQRAKPDGRRGDTFLY